MTKLQLIRFDLVHGLPTALGTLKQQLPIFSLFFALFCFALRSVLSFPFRGLEKSQSPAEDFTRHQLKPALILDDVLRIDLKLKEAKRMEILEEVIARTGARFIESNVRIPSAETWRNMDAKQRNQFTHTTMAKFLNAETCIAETPDDVFGFDVTHCHFAALTRKLEREHLARLFCKADSLYFDRADVLVQLSRNETIAGGDSRCAFRFQFSEDESK